MIHVDKMLNAIKSRTIIWTFQDIYDNAKEAKKIAAKLFIVSDGVIVRKTGPKTWIVLSWKRSIINE